MSPNAWWHSLPIEDLKVILNELNVDSTGTLDNLRRRLRAFLTNVENIITYGDKILDLQKRFAPEIFNQIHTEITNAQKSTQETISNPLLVEAHTPENQTQTVPLANNSIDEFITQNQVPRTTIEAVMNQPSVIRNDLLNITNEILSSATRPQENTTSRTFTPQSASTQQSQTTLPVGTTVLLTNSSLNNQTSLSTVEQTLLSPSDGSQVKTLPNNPKFSPQVNTRLIEILENQGKIMDQVRKWALKYDGKTSPLNFIERVEELANAYRLPLDVLPGAIPELLISRASLWYKNNNRGWETWASFRTNFLEFFLPTSHFTRLDDTIRSRLQLPRECCKDYVLALQDLMRQADYTKDKQLERIYQNSLPDYQLYIKRSEFDSLERFLFLAEEYERIKKLQNPRSNRDGVARLESDVIDVRNACHRCAQPGHFSRYCRNERVLFCWRCGKRDVRTIDCCLNRRQASGNVTEATQPRGLVVSEL